MIDIKNHSDNEDNWKNIYDLQANDCSNISNSLNEGNSKNLDPAMTEPSELFFWEKTWKTIKDTIWWVIEDPSKAAKSILQQAGTSGSELIEEVTEIWKAPLKSGEKSEQKMTEPSGLFSPKVLLQVGKSVVWKTFATGKLGVEKVGKVGKGIFWAIFWPWKEKTWREQDNSKAKIASLKEWEPKE